ncbi:hypothetical protein [Spongiimicrobium salis]|uniref:hypothetical protein n=1 Tax=Spongiimicrobium salis TaxID=1667022 RepID=UPI00374D7607
MKLKSKLLVLLCLCSSAVFSQGVSLKSGTFNREKDLLLLQYDCKTDVDDLHSVAAAALLLSHPDFSSIKYHAVAGTYGTQGGLYVPPNDLFQLAFEDQWTDAHKDFEAAVEKVKTIAIQTLTKNGEVWIAEAGQSNFSAALVKAIQNRLPQEKLSKRIHVIQHSDWNEKVTAQNDLDYIRTHTDYLKIPDGNAEGNGTPGFRSAAAVDWKRKITDSKLVKIWQLAIDLGLQYNGKEGRYNNKAIMRGGLDFSDFSELCWIFGMQDIKDAEHFFDLFSME